MNHIPHMRRYIPMADSFDYVTKPKYRPVCKGRQSPFATVIHGMPRAELRDAQNGFTGIQIGKHHPRRILIRVNITT